ncbi:MAG TPA: tRNA (N(6)-L-threonylcarbamoyladenosine(37)-C(2))-methylthiotransferase MtaB [Aquifex aeolicus]|uniref:Threonylcarbamoyladenosine tRNA methylthiotransferase MtaB n=1 Tax=Aquifex aeolicus TaxID=63363 RepID=A0A9D0YNM9_AQUAO|nr:tRNA (N(6)-L-threonylcarbamoyladenosine(37)-C(2))-methylthiotransferase MtaB [Aquificales bacterium]HIP86656.1 tRNA (N(6)-L-threonylcarbamoyladenosine(37)-C(2))-methylthiotransferase MtaB [Aquifex sp.]HIP97846.1 tRNA (N(6)-L-threonylcarbamoyladenosine(37)-C(2))-methylthiotransferase MtaB [Aquifex aeolicus]HIQ26317.1 tRNA (N(6)-L-threonylcarbamoyladenosine(37)-C(2))-methylthiotransferase MtaB [Aquifex aeolicus]
MNQFDTDFIRSQFLTAGYREVAFGERADIYVINTCTVTKGADRDSRKYIYRAKRINPSAVVVATGCYAQVNPKELERLKEVDLVVGNTHKGEILKLVEEYIERKNPGKVFVGEIFREGEVKNFNLVVSFENTRPFLKVQEGCNSFCTFCVIPFARGKVRSVPMEKVVAAVKKLADRGYKEIVLTGTQLSQYGWDLKDGTNLLRLLEELIRVEGIEYFRLSSMSVSEIDRELLELITSSPKIAPHFHLSLQSGSNRILKLMKRGYSPQEYEEKVTQLVERRPITAIGTDVIVGFPTEGEKEFGETLEFVKRLPLAYMHIFPYSDRPFTKASKLTPKVQPSVIKERVKLLKEIDEAKRKLFREKMKGKTLRALVLSNGELLTENYLSLKADKSYKRGEIVRVSL